MADRCGCGDFYDDSSDSYAWKTVPTVIAYACKTVPTVIAYACKTVATVIAYAWKTVPTENAYAYKSVATCDDATAIDEVAFTLT